MEAGRLEMPCWWTSTVDWHRQPVALVCIPDGCSFNFKLLPYSLLQQTDRYLLMNPRAPVTLASSEALGEQPLLLNRLLSDRVGAGGLHWKGVRPKVKGRGHRVLRCYGPPGRGYLGLMEWLKVERCHNTVCHHSISLPVPFCRVEMLPALDICFSSRTFL